MITVSLLEDTKYGSFHDTVLHSFSKISLHRCF